MDLPPLNGAQQPLPNGIPVKPRVEQNGGRIGGSPINATPRANGQLENSHGFINRVEVAQDGKQNGTSTPLVDRLDGLPIEIRQLTEHFRPFHRLANRVVQQTWNSFSDLLDQLSEITAAPNAPALSTSYLKSLTNGAGSGDQSPGNLEKKDSLLKFQQDQRAQYIKLLVLHDWFKKSRGIDQTIEMSMWMHDQRIHFTQAADFIGNMKRELALWQVPNPDLRTAIEILSNGKVSSLSDLGYVPLKTLSSKGILRTLQDINILLCTRLSLQDQVPLPLSKYRIHDGRVTFIVPHQFELDLSIADEDASSQFYFIDFRYSFLQRSTSLDGRLHDDFAAKMNGVLRTDGLLGCYDFLHDLTLSYKLNMLRRQVLEIARQQWSGNLRIDLINRTLVVQYWLNRPTLKSWIEIGVKSGRRKQRRDRFRSNEPYLNLRWIPEKIENSDIQVDFDASPLSMESILHGIISRHSSIILEGLYEKLLRYKLFAHGQLLLELSCSDLDPSDCSLLIQLTSSKHTTLAIEPISGSLILQPASSLSGRTEFELNRLQNPVEDGLQRISMLRCLAAEQEIVQQANIAGWEVLQTFRLSQHELRAVFPSNILRYVLIRLPSWQPSVMMAATFSMEGDKWWLLFPPGQSSTSPSATLVSHQIDCSLQDENVMDSMSLFSRLNYFASGAVTFKVAEQELRLKSLFCQLPALPQFQKDVQLPLMGVKYVLADARRALRSTLPGMDSNDAQTSNLPVTKHDKNDEDASWINPTISLKFCGLNDTSHDALMLAKGRTTASEKVFQSLISLTGPHLKITGNAGEFSMSFQVPIGQSFVSELFTSLLNFDRLLSCLTIIKSFDTMQIQSLSLSQIAIEYNRESALSTSIDFPSPSSTVAIALLPEGSNPHARICHFIEKLLPDLRRPFTANLGGVLTMLATTYPLLKLFDELEKLQTPIDHSAENGITPISSIIDLHFIARTPTHYALQYFASSTMSRTMIARFEIFHHLRRDIPVWILRPALEETVSYSRSSFVDNSLKQKLIDDVFNVRGAQGWLGLDTGASCPIDNPSPLMRKVDEVVRTWAKASLKDIVSTGQKQAEALKGESEEKTDELKTEASIPADLPQHQRHQQQQSGGPRAAANATGHSRPTTNAQRPPPQQSQQRHEDVITLD
jgi:mediator of RNA polymerase II transcription subunit 14